MVQAPSVYVCGFVERPDAPPKDACLHLDPLTVKSQLPLKKPLHLPDAPVGSVFGLYQSRAGLFSAASITSGDFLSLLDSIYHDCDIAQSQRLPLPREPKVEALHAWLPSLSLASLHPDIPHQTYPKPPQMEASCPSLTTCLSVPWVVGAAPGWDIGHTPVLPQSLHAVSQKSSIDCLSYELREGQRVVFRASGFTLCSIGVILNLGGDRRFQVTKVLQDPRNRLLLLLLRYLIAWWLGLWRPVVGSEVPCPAFVGPGRRWPLNTTRLGYWPHPCPASESPRGFSVPRNTFMTLLQTNLDNKPPRQTPLPYAAPLPPFSHQAIATAPSYGPGAGAVAPAGGYFTSPGGYYAGPAGGDPGAFLAMDAHTYHPHPHPPPAYFGLPGLFGPPSLLRIPLAGRLRPRSLAIQQAEKRPRGG